MKSKILRNISRKKGAQITRRTAEDIIEIGKDLIAVKERLPHGQFLPWIDTEFGMSNDTARRFMNVTEVYADKFGSVRNLPPTALYELAAPKTPVEVREEVERMIEAGEIVTKATVRPAAGSPRRLRGGYRTNRPTKRPCGPFLPNAPHDYRLGGFYLSRYGRVRAR